MNSTTPNTITEYILAFCREIDPLHEPMFVPVEPKEICQPYDCFRNTISYQNKHGGGIQYGWIIWEAPNVMFEAEFHAVWVSSEGNFIDITPKIDGEEQILFLPDSERRYENQLVDNIRKPLNNSPSTRMAVEQAKALFQFRKKHFKDGKVDMVSAMAEWQEYWCRQTKMYYLKPPKVGKNDPCTCGSGKKYKKCCGT